MGVARCPVREPDLRSTGRRFESRPPQCQVQPCASCLHTCASVTRQYYNLVPANGRWCSAVGEVTACLAEISGSLPPGLWLRSPAGWLPMTGISSTYPTLISSMELPLPSKDDGGGGDSWSYKTCKVPVKSPPTPNFLQAGCPSVAQPKCHGIEGRKYHIPLTWSRQAHLGSAVIDLTTKGSLLPRKKVVKPLVSHFSSCFCFC